VALRTIEDRLREEYFALLPELTRVAERLKTQIQYAILPISTRLKPHENLMVKARVKDCNSAINKLQQYNPTDPQERRNPGGVFDRDRPEIYTLLSLRDLVGIRILAFPSAIATKVDEKLRLRFRGWKSDPIRDKRNKQQLGYKYTGRYPRAGGRIQCEYQIVSTLIGLFWDVEHAAIYKQTPELKRVERIMRKQTSAVNRALKAFEDEFESQILKSGSNTSIG